METRYFFWVLGGEYDDDALLCNISSANLYKLLDWCKTNKVTATLDKNKPESWLEFSRCVYEGELDELGI